VQRKRAGGLNFKRNFIGGLITIIPLGVTWWLFDFIFNQLSKFGKPVVNALSLEFRDDVPTLSRLLLEPWFDDLLAVVVIVLGLYGLGWITTRVIGKQILRALESVLERLPLVQSVYSSIKKLIGVLQTKPENIERVVLINFPHSRMKAVGLVTRTLVDSHTGQELAAVYVPTTPNPTGGYLEVVPVDDLVSTDWTMDEAINFIMSGGAIAPDEVPFGAENKQV
jgi:uncharacterized membrane protein